MTKPNKQTDWKKKFEKFYLKNIGEDSSEVQLYSKLRDFIIQLLSRQRQQIKSLKQK